MVGKKIQSIALVWCIIGIMSSLYGIVSLGISLKGTEIGGALAASSYFAMALLIGMLISFILIIRLKKVGFYSFVVVSVISMVNNAIFVGVRLGLGINMGIAVGMFGLLGIAILYGVLQIGGESKTWNNLK